MTNTLTEHQAYHITVKSFIMSLLLTHKGFSYTIDVTGHVGRNPHRHFIPTVKTNYGKRYRGTSIWNHLQSDLYNAVTVQQFKSFFSDSCKVFYFVLLYVCVHVATLVYVLCRGMQLPRYFSLSRYHKTYRN